MHLSWFFALHHLSYMHRPSLLALLFCRFLLLCCVTLFSLFQAAPLYMHPLLTHPELNFLRNREATMIQDCVLQLLLSPPIDRHEARCTGQDALLSRRAWTSGYR